MQKKTTILTVLLLSACAGGAAPVDSKKLLAGMEGPKIPTVQDELTAAAENAEKSGNFRLAAENYQQVLEKHPDDKDLILSLAESFRRSGEPDKALPLYDLLIAKDQNTVAAKEGKGLALISKGDFDTSPQLFEDVLKSDATRWKTLNALGILFTTRNLHHEAQQYFNAALKYHADSPSILNNIGLSKALDRDYDGALESLKQASGFAAAGSYERKRIDLNMALVYASAGKLDEAKDLASNYLSGAELNNNLGLYAHLAKDDQLSRAYLNMALTDSKVFYEKAWDNLQDISANTTGNGPRGRKATTQGKAANSVPTAQSDTASPATATAYAPYTSKNVGVSVPGPGVINDEIAAPITAVTEKPALPASTPRPESKQSKPAGAHTNSDDSKIKITPSED